jgi:aquaporin Z
MVEAIPGSRYLAEFLGTFLLVLSIGCNVISGSATWAALSIASTLMVSIYAMGGVSGANFNPAVSVSLGLLGKLAPKEVCLYIISQLIGGATAALCYTDMFDKVINVGPAKGYGIWQAGLVETLYTFMLCFVVLNVATSKRHAGKDQFYGLAIGFVIVAGGYAGGHVSGGAFNPAVALSLPAFSGGLGSSLAYVFFELLGATLAAAVYHAVRPDDFDRFATGAPSEEYPTGSKLLSEFLGTFFLVLTVGLNVIGKSPAAALSIAAALMCMIFALGSCSGAHFNPAVTAAIVASGRGKCSVRDGVLYVMVQFLGGMVAAGTYRLIENGESFPLGPGPGFGWWAAAFAEIIFTFLLCFVVLSVATTAQSLSQYFGLAIGACIIAGGYSIGAVSGGSLNPAVSLGIVSAHAPTSGNGGLAFLLYTGAEITGAGLAAITFKLTHPSEYPRMK